MADQFCRIVDTTVTDSTLGSDAAQSVITTDASTSYVIRDVYKTDSCTCNNFCMKLDLEMDGHKIHTDVCTSASGTVIVPPSSTLSIKDTSGNYPLCYQDIEVTADNMHNAGCVSLSQQCTVNTVQSGSPSVLCDTCAYACVCCQGCTDSHGQKAFSPDGTKFFVSFAPQNSANSVFRIYDLDCSLACCIICRQQTCCGSHVHDGLLSWHPNSTCVTFHDLNCATLMCSSGCSRSCTSGLCQRTFMSSRHCGCYGCRGVITFVCPCDNTDYCFTVGNICNSGLFTCCSVNNLLHATAGYGLLCTCLQGGSLKILPFWSATMCTWVVVGYSANNEHFGTARLCDLNSTGGGTCTYACLTGESILSGIALSDFADCHCYIRSMCAYYCSLYFRSCVSCALWSLNLDCFAKDETVVLTCHGLTDCIICNCTTTHVYKYETPSACVSSRTYDTNPSSKLNIYGIKST